LTEEAEVVICYSTNCHDATEDVFNFDPTTGKIESLIILYDPHPLRERAGDKYA
jgi:hypothetical protein